MDNEILDRVFAAVDNPAELARRLGITRHAVYQWRRVPIERVAEVSRITGIPRSELRPDIFDANEAA